MTDAADLIPHLVDVEPLIPYEHNARTHSPAQIGQIMASIQRFGFVGVIAYEGTGLKIGHGRREAALALWAAGETIYGPGKRAALPKGQLPAIDLAGLPAEAIRALVIADNKLALNAGWDDETLRAELTALAALDFDMPVLGFDESELDRFLNPPDNSGPAPRMADEFLVPPFTVLNAREGWWQDRKRAWIAIGIKSEVGRGEARKFGQDLMRGEHVVGEGKALTYSGPARDFDHYRVKEGTRNSTDSQGTSIFDPVLTELAYRWFCPAGGTVLDPFAGGSVRGIVAAALGLRYVGVELRAEQVAANVAQWPVVAPKLGDLSGTAPLDDRQPTTGDELTRVSDFGGWWAKREDDAAWIGDDHPSGAKVRQFRKMAAATPGAPMIVGCSADSAMQIYVASAAKLLNVPALIFVSARKVRSAATRYAAEMGAQIFDVKPGHLSVCKARAREHAKTLDGFVKWNPKGAIADSAEQCANIPAECRRVVVPTGTGAICAGIVAGLAMLDRSDVDVLAVTVSGMTAIDDILANAAKITDKPLPNVALVRADSRYEDPVTASLPDGTPLDPFYAAKALPFVQEGDCLWIPGLRPLSAFPTPQKAVPLVSGCAGAHAPEWHVGDSAAVLPDIDVAADFLFTCPPYGDLEVYSDDPADISAMPVADFDRVYAQIIGAAVAKLRNNRFAAIVVGDYRDKRTGIYCNLVSKTVAAFQAAGAQLYNEAILVTVVGSLPMRTARQFRSGRKLGKTHQNILVFVKGDPKKATIACGDVDVGGALANVDQDEAE